MSILHFDVLPKNVPYGAIVSIDTNQVTCLTHGFHKYPGKFIPQIPRWAINTFLTDKSQIVVDPFVGSGTSLVESLVLGFDSIGIDIDPLSCLITKVKSTPINLNHFCLISEWILENMYTVTPYFYPATHNIDHWFSVDSILKLQKIRTLIDRIPGEFSHFDNVTDLFNTFIIAFSGIIRKVSKADNQSQKTYVSSTKPKKPAEVYATFSDQIRAFYNGYQALQQSWNGKAKSLVIRSEGNADVSLILSKKADLVVTSPPYIKAIDYVYNQMVELFWIGDLFGMDTQVKQNENRKKYLGTTLVSKRQIIETLDKSDDLEVEMLSKVCKEILKDNKNGQKHEFIVRNYFSFMFEHFGAIKRAMNIGGIYTMTVGNSSVSNVDVDTAGILIELANRNGFVLENRWSYIIKNHYMGFDRKNRGGKINIDNVLVFKNM